MQLYYEGETDSRIDWRHASLSEIIGQTFEGFHIQDSMVTFDMNGGHAFLLGISPDDAVGNSPDIAGDISWLVGSPILKAEERSQEETDTENGWTFYEIATIKGAVTLRFLPGSDGYYSVSVDSYKSAYLHKAEIDRLRRIRALSEKMEAAESKRYRADREATELHRALEIIKGNTDAPSAVLAYLEEQKQGAQNRRNLHEKEYKRLFDIYYKEGEREEG